MKKLIILVFVFAALFMRGQQTNTDLSNYPYYDAEPTLAANPTNPSNLIAAWMKATGLNQVSIACVYSNDGGASWSSPALLPHVSASFTCADVSITFNAGGTAYICYIDSKINLDSGYVVVAKSLNGGQTWSTPVKVLSAQEKPDLPVDRPWIAVDNTSGPYSGRVYVVSKGYFAAPLPHHVWMKSSADGGLTWSSIKQLDDSIPTDQVTNSMGVPAVGADGHLYVAYASYHPSQNVYARMVCTQSADGGASFMPYIIGNYAANSGVTDTLFDAGYTLSCDPTHAGVLAYTGTDARNGDPDILTWHSTDGGLTWSSTPTRVNNDPVGNGIGQDMCWAAFTANGYFVVWRDRRASGTSGSSAPFEVYAAGSSDNGQSYWSNQKLSTAASPVIKLHRGNDFLGVAVGGFQVSTCWGDNRTGNIEIYTASIETTQLIPDLVVETPPALPITCYPSPTDGSLHISFSPHNEGTVTLAVYDLQGKAVMQLPARAVHPGRNELIIDVPQLAPGYYILRTSGQNLEGETRFEKR